MNYLTTKCSCWRAWLALLAMTVSISIHAAPGTLSQVPLFTSTNNVQPNIFLTLDNSGSMDMEILTKQYWNLCAYDRDAADLSGNGDCGSIRSDGNFYSYAGTSFTNPGASKSTTVKTYGYIYQNTDDVYYTTSCPGGEGEASFACINTTFTNEVVKKALEYDWRIRSSALNTVYYNPATTYSPWQKADGSIMDQASFTAARSNPQPAKAGYALTKDLTGFVFEVWEDSHGFNTTDARPRRGININRTTGANGWVDVWDNHIRYTVNAGGITKESVIYEPTTTGTNSSKPPKGTLNPKIVSTETLTQGLSGRSLEAEKQNIANWYQYYRRRAFATKGAVAKALSENPDYRYGLTVIHTPTTLFLEVPAAGVTDYKTHNAKLLQDLFNYVWLPRSTPLQAGLDATGKYFSHQSIGTKAADLKADPITSKCQQSFAILFSDGYWNGAFKSLGDKDGDSYPDTVADVAKYYYDTKKLVTFTIAFGLQGNLVAGSDGWPIADSKGKTPVIENSDWGDPSGTKDTPEKLDDMWHAAYNAKGTFLSASSPEAVSQGFANIIASIGGRGGGSASSVSFNTNTLTSNTAVYLAQFVSPSKKSSENPDWVGDLKASSINASTGTVSAEVWSAAGKLLSQSDTSRKIFTYNRETHKGIAFQWANLADNQKQDLLTNTDNSIGSDISKGQARLAYLRGNRANEGKGDGLFRKRSQLLSDIVHSDPLFVGSPQSSWPATAPFTTNCSQTYAAFRTAKANRAKVVYVGANDGMLHGFAASDSAGNGYGDGRELMAYIPNSLFSSGNAITGLHYLTDQNYTHRYYVDLPATLADVCIDTSTTASKGSNKTWHSLVLGGVMAGGRGIFALDVTDPSATNFAESNASKIALWEFDNTDDADMGYSYSKPVIAMMQNGRWAAIFGNGYNATGADSTGNAALFILFLDGGLDGVWTKDEDYIKIAAPTSADKVVGNDCINGGSNCNGLSSPQVVDINRDYQMDRAYAGDIKGNLWAFDMSDSDPKKWKIAYSTKDKKPAPLFTASHYITPSIPATGIIPTPVQQKLCAGAACVQQITTKPIVVKNPLVSATEPNVLVFFGTGQYMVDGDLTSKNIQSFYGVWDHGVAELTPANLIEQTYIPGPFYNAGVERKDVRVLTSNPVKYNQSNNTTNQGWFINLSLASGERLVVDPDLRIVDNSNTQNNDVIFFNTWIPVPSECSAGGTSFNMSVDMTTGGSPKSPAFDLNGSSSVNDADKVTVNGVVMVVAGIASNSGLDTSSTIIGSKLYNGNTNSTAVTPREIITGPPMRRISWQELRSN